MQIDATQESFDPLFCASAAEAEAMLLMGLDADPLCAREMVVHWSTSAGEGLNAEPGWGGELRYDCEKRRIVRTFITPDGERI